MIKFINFFLIFQMNLEIDYFDYQNGHTDYFMIMMLQF